MQDILFGGAGTGGGGGGGGDRRLRLSSQSLQNHHQNHNQALKCPRCDSLNTKFCYYNNYNLSQPRHFCKSCHRYWTKGGVLRNVPVGGGCRKSKRSSKSKPKPNSTSTSSAPPSLPLSKCLSKESCSHSSSDSANITITVEAIGSNVHNESKLLLHDPGMGFEPAGLLDQPWMFPDMESFTNLMASSSDASLPLGTDKYAIEEEQQQFQATWNQQNYKVIDDRAGENAENGRDFEPLDWQGINGGDGEAGLFDLSLMNVVDQAYWS